MEGWSKLPITLSELCISTVLRCGQSFRWKQHGPIWSCALSSRILQLQQTPTTLFYKSTFPSPPKTDDTAELIHDYFNLSTDLTEAYARWSAADPNFKKVGGDFGGVRMLRQDPWENVCGFICSSNNNIKRIGQMVENLCVHFGPKLGTVDGVDYYDFPQPEKLAEKGVEEKLRKLGFGYRAKYIHQTALTVSSKEPSPLAWLEGLRKLPYREAHDALLELSGVGPKVADCICLMSLDKKGAVPVDTHVWQIAQRDYKFKLKGKTLNKAVYDAIGDHFRALWGEDAGWAHSVLFAADLGDLQKEKKAIKAEVKEEVTEVKLEEVDEAGTTESKKRVTKRKTKVEVKAEETEEAVPAPTMKAKKVMTKKVTKSKAVAKTETAVSIKKEVVVAQGIKREAIDDNGALEDGSVSGVRKRTLRSGRER